MKMRIAYPFSKTSSLLLLFTTFLLTSCFGVKKFQDDLYSSRDKDRKAFVETKDGTITEANEARLRTPLFGKSTIELDNSVRIPVKEIAAYQNNVAYYRSVDGQFAPRVKKGLINVYLTTQTYSEFQSPSSFNGNMGRTRTRTRYIYHLQKGDRADIRTLTPELTRSYVQDYAPAMEFMNTYDATQKKVKTWSWINTGAVIGGLFLASQGFDKDQNITPMGYASVSMFLGGFVNGFVNKIRRAKNQKNLEFAINEYNHQALKKRK